MVFAAEICVLSRDVILSRTGRKRSLAKWIGDGLP